MIVQVFKRKLFLLFFLPVFTCNCLQAQPFVLKADDYKHYIDSFNENDRELYRGAICNDSSWAFLSQNIPLLDCPDGNLEETYYFRWWTYRKHIKETPEGYVITEFMPDVPWAGKYNAISCPAAFHFYEGRWLHEPKYLSQYANYWFFGGGEPRRYSFWAADALYNFYKVTGKEDSLKKMLPALVKNYESWEQSNLDSTGLFWQVDDRDGMEVSICGNISNGIGYRPTLNAYMYGDAVAIAGMATMLHQKQLADVYANKAQHIKKQLQEKLWNNASSFFTVQPKLPGSSLCSARELLGYTPWYFNMPDVRYSKAWRYAMDSTCFFAPFGLTSADQQHPDYRISYEGHECQWNGPSWPYATSVTLTALANLLNNYVQAYIGREDYYKLLSVYAASQHRTNEQGKQVRWIDENLNPYTDDWISRTRLKTWDNGGWSSAMGGVERGKDYNHSTFCDLLITGLIGLHPQMGNRLVINPLLPKDKWDYFCLDNILYHGKIITIFFDKTGLRYHKGKGMFVMADGKVIAKGDGIGRMDIAL